MDDLDDLDDLETLRTKYSELATLAGSLAHEIKNPLSIIRMNMELLGEDLDEFSAVVGRRTIERVETVNRQCARLETLLNDFLRFSRFSSLQFTAGCLNDQVAQVLDFYRSQAATQNVEVVKYLETDLPGIKMDPHTLQAALANLVKNAIEAMPEGGQLVARTRITRTGVALDLIDTGCGMEGEALMRMFEEFYTSKDSGTGLGLPTAKKIIEGHGGRINVQSKVGQGTQFTLEFPTPKRIREATDTAPAASSTKANE